ncbi:UPF0160 protein MYG1, mitochondrial-like isoform X2 [Odontomachus brunneus]|nr:UPF0160 protein MYG1, mitochondrial-like isoform X2 [Odontomachus brunneus]XP_032683073.1 UPF0160 protein MYG1, mitochondrial-like isoform X2 [Odontomachus brunneus]
MSENMDKKVKIGTHNGVFHCDEVLACVLLKLLPQYMNATIVRSRDQDILDKCDIVVDVGGVYDHSAHRYDHHMREFCQTSRTVLKNPNYNDKIKLSSAGLIYCHFGHEILRNLLPEVKDEDIEAIFKKIYNTLIVEIDAIDNGIQMYEHPLYSICTNLSSQVKHLNPPWNSTNMNEEEQFEKAMALVLDVFMDFVTRAEKIWLPAKEVVRNAVANRFTVDPSGEIMELSEPAPWEEHLFTLEEELTIRPLIKFVIFSRKGENRVQAVPSRYGVFECRFDLPNKWWGLRDDTLVAACGIEGAIFVHATGFIGGHKTRDGTLAMAREALKIIKHDDPNMMEHDGSL